MHASSPTLRSPSQASSVPYDVAPFPEIDFRRGGYRVRFASSWADILAALRLRFEVFNLELGEGLVSTFQTGHDHDQFDEVCDHLIVEHSASRRVVGTYRLQTGRTAGENGGYYSEREFDFRPYEPLRERLVELGRACIHRNHRSSDVLHLLWQGIARYVEHHHARFVVGCSSLTSQEPADGVAIYDALRDYIVSEELRTLPKPAFTLPATLAWAGECRVPKLLRTYLAIGANICGPPAIDPEFKTIDFLTLLDLQGLHPRIRARFLQTR
jgi:putative hemolysin